MTDTTITKGTLVTDGRGRLYRVVAVMDVFGIPAADLVRVRKSDGQTWGRGDERACTRIVNRPLSWLEVV